MARDGRIQRIMKAEKSCVYLETRIQTKKFSCTSSKSSDVLSSESPPGAYFIRYIVYDIIDIVYRYGQA